VYTVLGEMEKHIKPAVARAGIAKRVSWHTLRHTFGTLVKSQGADIKTTQELMRHANASVTLHQYVQAVTPAKREAQQRILEQLTLNDSKMLKSITASC